MLKKLRSLLFDVLFYGYTLLLLLILLPLLLGPPQWVRWAPRAWAGGLRWIGRLVLGVRCEVAGWLPRPPVIVAAKHESMYETIMLMGLLDNPAVVLKKELMKIPLWGRVARQLGVIPIDRSRSSAALREMMRAADQAIADGRSILIFPEGTRATPGTAPPLKPGLVGLYRHLKHPVVPVQVRSGHVWPLHGPKQPGTVRIRFLDPIPAGADRKTIESLVHARINGLGDA